MFVRFYDFVSHVKVCNWKPAFQDIVGLVQSYHIKNWTNSIWNDYIHIKRKSNIHPETRHSHHKTFYDMFICMAEEGREEAKGVRLQKVRVTFSGVRILHEGKHLKKNQAILHESGDVCVLVNTQHGRSIGKKPRQRLRWKTGVSGEPTGSNSNRVVDMSQSPVWSSDPR